VAHRHRRKIGSYWRELNPGQQAPLVLVHLRKGDTFAALAAGFGVGTATAWRYVHEAVASLAAPAPKLDTALAAAGMLALYRELIALHPTRPELTGPGWTGSAPTMTSRNVGCCCTEAACASS
jgi:Helix-turn-helix of DDE superfamily endonuclease